MSQPIYRYPEDMEPFKYISSAQDLRLKLQASCPGTAFQSFRIRTKKNRIRAICKYCPVVLNFKKPKSNNQEVKKLQQYHLGKWNNYHLHNSNKRSQLTMWKSYKRAIVKRQTIEESINVHGMEETQKYQYTDYGIKEDAMIYAEKPFRLQTPRPYGIKKEECSFQQFVSCLSEMELKQTSIFNLFLLNSILYMPLDQSPQNQKGQSAIFCTEGMLDQFRNYGQFLTFCTFSGFVKTAGQQKAINLGIFAGLDSGYNSVPFAYAIFREQTVQTYQQIFQKFFMLTKKTIPNTLSTIIISTDTLIKKALKRVKKSCGICFSIMFDVHCVLAHIRTLLQDKNNLKYFPKIISAKSQQSFKFYFKQMLNHLAKSQQEAVTCFAKGADQFCFARMRHGQGILGHCNSFISVYSYMQRVIQGMFDPLQHHDPLQVCKRLLRMKVTNRTEMEGCLLEQVFQLSEFVDLRKFLSKNVLSHIVKQLGKTFQLAYLHQNEYQYRVKPLYSFKKLIKAQTAKGYSNNFQYDIFKDDSIMEYRVQRHAERWICDCKFSQKAGLPCQHQLKVCLLNRNPFLYQIHRRWLIRSMNYYTNTQSNNNASLIEKKNVRKPRKPKDIKDFLKAKENPN